MIRSSFVAVVVLSLVACGGSVVVDGYTLNGRVWQRDQQMILSRASYELQCPAEQITLTVLGLFPGNDRYAGQVGARGCGQQMVYVDPPGSVGWIANGSNTSP